MTDKLLNPKEFCADKFWSKRRISPVQLSHSSALMLWSAVYCRKEEGIELGQCCQPSPSEAHLLLCMNGKQALKLLPHRLVNPKRRSFKHPADSIWEALHIWN